MNPLIQLKQVTSVFLIAFGLTYFGSLTAQAVSPPPDGGYAGGNTAEGQNALLSLTTGGYNAAIGWLSLESNTTGIANTGVGAGTLALNNGDRNTATGAGALLFNSTGADNTAYGAFALLSNDSSGNGTANSNTAVGDGTLQNNIDGGSNTAVGFGALQNSTGDYNTALGAGAGTALGLGSNNILIGDAGFSSSFDVISIGAIPPSGIPYSRTYIGGIYNSVEQDRPVYVDSHGHLGSPGSSRRYKEEIKPMDKASEALFALKPVTFRYKQQIDPSQRLSFGLVAEDVAKVSADLISRDKEGKPQTVRYEAVNAMLLNEFLKEHKKVEQQSREIREQKDTISTLEKRMAGIVAQIKEEASQIQKVSAQLRLSKSATRTVADKSN
jgi:trimeric autotransporter adhesin